MAASTTLWIAAPALFQDADNGTSLAASGRRVPRRAKLVSHRHQKSKRRTSTVPFESHAPAVLNRDCKLSSKPTGAPGKKETPQPLPIYRQQKTRMSAVGRNNAHAPDAHANRIRQGSSRSRTAPSERLR